MTAPGPGNTDGFFVTNHNQKGKDSMKQAFKATLWGVGLLFVMTAGTAGKAMALELNGFGDVDYVVTEEGGVSNNGFFLGQLDFYAVQRISDRSSVLVEYVIESPGAGFVIDLERLQVDYELSDRNVVRVGRFHNLLGYWNTAFHHGAHLQTTVGRPFFLEFEDENGIIPVHMVGAWWDSRIDTGAGRFELGLMVGNGVHLMANFSLGEIAELDPDSGGDRDNDKALSWRLAFSPSAVEGLEIGTSGQAGTVNKMDLGGGVLNDEIDQLLLSADLSYRKGGTELLAEYYAWSHDSMADATTYDGSSAYYVQVAQRVGSTTPYVRYEALDAESDPYFDAVGMTSLGVDRKKTVTVAGFRHDLSPASSLKAEYRAVDDDVDGSYNEGNVQWSFMF